MTVIVGGSWDCFVVERIILRIRMYLNRIQNFFKVEGVVVMLFGARLLILNNDLIKSLWALFCWWCTVVLIICF